MWRPQKGKKPYVRQIEQIKQQKSKEPSQKNILANNYDKNDYTKNVEVLHNMKTFSKERKTNHKFIPNDKENQKNQAVQNLLNKKNLLNIKLVTSRMFITHFKDTTQIFN